jgi:hypothetical protein
MATRTWIGSAQLAAQVTSWALAGTWEATDVIIFTIGTRSFSLVAGSTNTTTIAALMASTWNALNATNYLEFSAMTASSNTATFTLTGDTAGVPFTVTISTTETGGGAADAQTIDGSTSSAGVDSTACSSPNHWSLAANWAEGAVPVNSDDVVIDRGSVSIKYGLAQSAVTLTSLTVTNNFTGDIGLPTRNSIGYEEYRATQLAISATTMNIGTQGGRGSGRLKINNGSVATTVNVYNTGTPSEQGLAAFLWKGTNASNVLNVFGGSVGVATFSGETAVIATLRQTAGQSTCTAGTTLTTIDKTGGTLTIESAATTITNGGGDITINGTGAVTTINAREGTVNYNSTGTVTNLNVYDGGGASFNAINKARTVTNCQVTSGGTLTDSNKTVTWTNGIDLYQCGLGAVQLDVGEHLTLSTSAI